LLRERHDQPAPDLLAVRSMMRTASSASASRTDTRVSPSVLTVNGNMPGGAPAVRTDSTPWLSSSAWTTLASMSECVRKTTVSGHQVIRHLDIRIMVMSSCWSASPANALQLGQDVRAQLVERQMRVLLDHRGQPRLAVAVERLVHRLADAVGEQHDDVVVVERDRASPAA
jgi:hypothetical protein